MKIMIAGDWHGNAEHANTVIKKAGARKIKHLFVVGDCGLWSGLEGIVFLDSVNRAALDARLSVFFVPGNHDNYDILEHYQKHAPTHKGFYYLRERLLMCGKVNSFKLDRKRFLVAGGAVSIDKEWRIANERHGERNLWWPQEQLTDEEESKLLSMGEFDYMLSHDCSNHTTWKNRLKPDLDSEAHRQRIDRVIASAKPKVHFHGHMHEFYDWENTASHGFYSPDEEGAIVTQTYGLACDGMPYSAGIFDTETAEFEIVY